MKHIIGLIAFAVMSIIVWWSTTGSLVDDEDSKQSQTQRYVEIFMNEFEMTAMNDDGTPSYRLTGKQLERYNNSDDSEIKMPVIYLLDAKNQWVVSADFALANDKKETVLLTSNVIMQQQNAEPAITIHTQNMLIHTRTQIAQTKSAVDITWGNSRLKSTGMIYNNQTSDMEFSSSVNGFYLPYD